MTESTVNVRYIVDDVDAAVAWYTRHLGFELQTNAAPAASRSWGTKIQLTGRLPDLWDGSGDPVSVAQA